MTGLLAGIGAAVAVLALTEGLRAQQGTTLAPTGRVATLDVIKVFNEFQMQKDLIEEIKAEQGKLQAEEQRRRQDIDNLTAQLSALDPKDPTHKNRAADLLARQVDYKNWVDLKQAAMNREIGLWSAELYRRIVAAAEAVGQAGGYDVVFYRDEFEVPANLDPQAIQNQIRGRKILYSNSAVDLTQAVLDKLNADYRAKPRQPMLQVP
jgi:Skp family chaperone for outer membrane proteins